MKKARSSQTRKTRQPAARVGARHTATAASTAIPEIRETFVRELAQVASRMLLVTFGPPQDLQLSDSQKAPITRLRQRSEAPSPEIQAFFGRYFDLGGPVIDAIEEELKVCFSDLEEYSKVHEAHHAKSFAKELLTGGGQNHECWPFCDPDK